MKDTDMTNSEKVAEFMTSFGQEVVTKPVFPNKDVMKMRVALIDEELQELKDAIKDRDIVEVADALTDILYVVYGAGHTFGVDLDACFSEVHRSNMSKLMPDDSVKRREDGKVLKPLGWKAPELAQFLKKGNQ